MTESEAKSARIRCGASVRFLVVANAARSNFFARLGFAARRVTAVTLIVRSDPGWDCERCCTTAQTAVTGCASARWPGWAGHVLSMIEFHVEAFVEFRRKTSQRRISTADVRMTYGAHRNRRGNKLSQMAPGAGLMSGEPRRRGIIAALVASGAGQ